MHKEPLARRQLYYRRHEGAKRRTPGPLQSYPKLDQR